MLEKVKVARRVSADTSSVCMNCVHAGDCVLREHATGPILQCEEYYLKPETNAASSSTAAEAEIIEYKGLCSDCKHRSECHLSGTESGVWHCEHYS